ncbi:MAG: thioredoxin-dependent thiol peroxidase [Bacteroidetes bacterium]|nr:thioredoxin-dependent thiol peroxidase [Bacteroidota bacterium]
MVKNTHSTRLKEGDKAPDFSFVNSDGATVSLKDLKGKKVILYFYPKDDTPGCTAESCNLRDNYSSLKRKGYEVIGVSKDDEKSHGKFIKKFKLPFALIPDTGKEIIKDYDVWGKKTFMGKTFDGIIRTTFVIDEKGKIEKIIRKVDTKNHTEQISETNSVTQ